MAKMKDVQYGVPENFLSGVGQYDYSYDDTLMGLALGWLGASDDDILMGLSGVGRMAMPGQQFNLFVKMNNAQLANFIKKNPANAQARAEMARRTMRPGVGGKGTRPPSGVPFLPPAARPPPPPGTPSSVMNAIIQNAKELNAKKQIVAAAQKKAAQANPLVALKLAQQKKRTSAPGSNEVRAISIALNTAAKKAMAAKKDEAAAKKLLAQSDKRGAAAKAVSALTKAREAAITANRAEKTRLTRALDLLANTLKAQADYLDSLVKMESARGGQNPRTMALAATAQALRENIKRIQAQSGVVAAMPNVPANAPKQQRIADLANKFNIRTASKNKFMLDKAVVSVLGDLAESPLAQTQDYEGALMYYGADSLGQMMADMEFDNYSEAMGRLSGLMGGIGYTDTTPILAQADDVVASASLLAQTTYNDVVLPAAGLGDLHGLGFFGPSWEKWCDDNVPGGKTDSAKAYKGDVPKCKAQPNIVARAQAPWTLPGIQARGGDVNWGKVLADAPKVVGKAVEDVKKLGTKVQQAVGGKKPPLPATVKPPVEVPAPAGASPVQQAKEVAIEVAQKTADIATTSVGGVPVYVYAIGGVAVLGAAYFFLMKPKAAMA